MNIFHRVTLKTLKENRTRTLVTIIGIILSAAMFTAVTTSISSLRHFLIQSTIYDTGDWYGVGYGISSKEIEKITADSKVARSTAMEFLGFHILEDSANDSKPYLCLYGIQTDFTELMPIHLLEGRMPENSSEILLPEHLKTNGGIDWSLEESLTLELGTRTDSQGEPLFNRDSFVIPEEDDSDTDGQKEKSSNSNTASDASINSDVVTLGMEQFLPQETRTYTVVGFYERPSYESYEAPGYTALTIGDASADHPYDLYLKTNTKGDTSPTLERLFENQSDAYLWRTNTSLLRLYGYSGESSYNRVLYSLGVILVGIIMFGSISLIYNAFSISVSERTRQFGLLASIGATKRQLDGSVLFEALLLSLIGIPLGILSGLLGIGITFFFVRDMMTDILGFTSLDNYTMARLTNILGPSKGTSLTLHLSFAALAIAVAVSLLTVMISAYIPAIRATKKPAIDAIRQTNDISIRSRKVKTSWLTQKLFGFEGMIATKNYKRNRKKYRATVISLFLSIVLFISASSLCTYLTISAGSIMNDSNYDLLYYLEPENNYPVDTLLSELSKAKGVTGSTYATHFGITCTAKTSGLTEKMQDHVKKQAEQWGETYREHSETDIDVSMIFLADDDFRSYLRQQNLPEDTFFNKETPVAVAMDTLRTYDDNEKKYYRFPAFANGPETTLDLYLTRMRKDYGYGGIYRNEDGKTFSCFSTYDEDELLVPIEESCVKIPLTIGALTQKAPDFFPDESDYIRLFYPLSLLNHVFSSLEKNTEYYEIPDVPLDKNCNFELYFKCEDHTATSESMMKLLSAKNLPLSSFYDYAHNAESNRAMVTVINVFSFGFIILISLIAAANVFNTISTNLNLRRREFAMLKSIGMTPKAFSRMMNFECLLYGLKGLLYGLPVSFLVTWFIYRSIANGLETPFFVPWYSIAIAVGSVFLVVFVTMLYTMRKIKKENTIDALKNENL